MILFIAVTRRKKIENKENESHSQTITSQKTT